MELHSYLTNYLPICFAFYLAMSAYPSMYVWLCLFTHLAFIFLLSKLPAYLAGWLPR